MFSKCSAKAKLPFFSPSDSAVLIAFVLALAVSVAATAAGGVLHREERICRIEGAGECGRFYNYGWPWQWRTSLPDEHLDRVIENSDRNFFSVNEDGYSPGLVLITATLWFTIALAAQAVLAIAGWGSWRLVKRRGASSA